MCTRLSSCRLEFVRNCVLRLVRIKYMLYMKYQDVWCQCLFQFPFPAARWDALRIHFHCTVLLWREAHKHTNERIVRDTSENWHNFCCSEAQATIDPPHEPGLGSYEYILFRVPCQSADFQTILQYSTRITRLSQQFTQNFHVGF